MATRCLNSFVRAAKAPTKLAFTLFIAMPNDSRDGQLSLKL
jgi:hypothetical protein